MTSKKSKYKLWKPTNVMCACNFKSLIRNINPNLNKIETHIYDHMFCRYVLERCTKIIRSYIGPIYSSRTPEYVMTLGLSFINNDDMKSNHGPVISKSGDVYCQIPYCGEYIGYCKLSLLSNIYQMKLCTEHYNQREELLITYIHKHNCEECYVNLIHVKRLYSSIIMKLNKIICHNIMNIILSFCFVQISYKCRGHIQPRKYKCETCDQINRTNAYAKYTIGKN
jgi:hypothetical protein